MAKAIITLEDESDGLSIKAEFIPTLNLIDLKEYTDAQRLATIALDFIARCPVYAPPKFLSEVGATNSAVKSLKKM